MDKKPKKRYCRVCGVYLGRYDLPILESFNFPEKVEFLGFTCESCLKLEKKHHPSLIRIHDG